MNTQLRHCMLLSAVACALPVLMFVLVIRPVNSSPLGDMLPPAPPVFAAPHCGTTNNPHPVFAGWAPDGITVTLYNNGSFLATTVVTNTLFTYTDTSPLPDGSFVLTATASNWGLVSQSSRPLTLTVSRTLPYDPVGVTFSYQLDSITVTQHPRGSNGCTDLSGWRVWLRPTFTATIRVPVSYTTSAAITATIDDQNIRLMETEYRVFTGVLTPPVPLGQAVITVTADGVTSVSTGLVALDNSGYVQSVAGNGTGSIIMPTPGVTVTCEYSETVYHRWLMWNGTPFDHQQNPQVTNHDGAYSFHVPPGIYRLTIHHPDYFPYASGPLQVLDAPAQLPITLQRIAHRAYLPLVENDANARNLLANGDFETSPPWPMQDSINELQVAPGWRAWYRDWPPSYVQTPVNCGNNSNPNCYWMRPEFRDVVATAYPYRVHSGSFAQKYFSYGRMHEAGLLQQISNITPGSPLLFSVYIQAWMCFEFAQCDHGQRSDAPTEMHLRIGIDPTDGIDPFSPNIVWSAEAPAWDTWARFQVQAVAQSSTVTVFTHSRPEWEWARRNNDVYVDDARLVVVP